MGTLLLVFSLSVALSGASVNEKALAEAARLEQSGDLKGALGAYRALLREARRDDPDRPTILGSLALLETRSADYGASVEHASEAAGIYARRGDTRRRGIALNTVGMAQTYAGNYRAAESSFETAVNLLASAVDADAQAEAVTNLGSVHVFLGRYTDADAAYDEALRLADQHRGEPWSARRKHLALVNRAVLYQRLGRDEQALAVYKALDADGNQLPVREQAQSLVNQGVLYRHLGDPLKALASYDQALALFTRDHHVDAELGVMKNRGIALALDLGQLDAARRTFSEALTQSTAAGNHREMLQARLYRAETQLRSGLVGEARLDFGASLDEARAMGTREEEWKALYGLGRLDVLAGRRTQAAVQFEAALSVIESIRESIRVPTLKSDFFSDKREVYDALIAAVADTATPDRLFSLVERSHSRAWRERLGLPASVTLRQVQDTLPADVVLLDLWQSPLGAAAIMVTRAEATIVRIEMDPAAVRVLLEAVSTGPSAGWQAAAARVAAGASFPIPPTARHLVIVPDGVFALVPFELLPARGGLLIEQVTVSYAPTAALLLRPPTARLGIAPPWRRQLLAFGDPTLATSALDDTAVVRGRLAASGDEVRGVVSELGGASALHVGRDDRKAYLVDDPHLPPILHIASHAVADVQALEQSRILFAPSRDDGAEADYLFLREAYDLKLDGVELAVLSACDTERGRLLRGEGVQSFSRAFLAAGARSTVTTLWRVADAPTATFMRIFYHHLQLGETRADALRLTKLRFMSSGSGWSHPHYWAAFVLTGDGADPIPRAMPWSRVGGWTLGGLLIAWLATRATRRTWWLGR